MLSDLDNEARAQCIKSVFDDDCYRDVQVRLFILICAVSYRLFQRAAVHHIRGYHFNYYWKGLVGSHQ